MTRTAALGLGACGRAEDESALENVRGGERHADIYLGAPGRTGIQRAGRCAGVAGEDRLGHCKRAEEHKKAIKALLHDRLYQSCHFYLEQEWVDMQGLTNVGYIYESYHELGGNGTGTALYNKIKELPIRDS